MTKGTPILYVIVIDALLGSGIDVGREGEEDREYKRKRENNTK